MWIVDERYWLMAANASLRTLVGNAIAEKRPKAATLRPDFACAQGPGRGVIIEIKRPSHQLAVADLNQAERDVVLAEEFSANTEWTAILVGQSAEPEVRKTVKHRKDVTIRTYNELPGDTRHRYRQYLQAFETDAETAASDLVDRTRKRTRAGSGSPEEIVAI